MRCRSLLNSSIGCYGLPIADTLNGLPPSLQIELRAIYAERPASLLIRDNTDPIQDDWAKMNSDPGIMFAPTYARDERQLIEDWLTSTSTLEE